MKFSLKYFSAILLVSLSLNWTRAQNLEVVDSLNQVLKTTTSDSVKVRCYYNLMKQYVYTRPDTSIEIGDKAESLFKQAEVTTELKIKTVKTKALAYYVLGDYNNCRLLSEEGIGYYDQGFESKEWSGKTYLDSKIQSADNYTFIGITYYAQSEQDSAIANYKKALQIKYDLVPIVNDGEQMEKLYSSIAGVHNNSGIIHWQRADYAKALDHYFTGLTIHEKLGEEGLQASLLNNIGLIYQDKSEHSLAITYFQKSIEAKYKLMEEDENGVQTINTKWDFSSSYSNIANSHLKLFDSSSTVGLTDIQHLEVAIENFEKAVRIAVDVENNLDLTLAYSGIGNMYMDLALSTDSLVQEWLRHENIVPLDSAEKYSELSVGLFGKTKNLFYQAKTYNLLGRLSTIKGKDAQAAIYYEQGAALALQINSAQSRRVAHKSLSEIYSEMGNYKGAYENHVLYTAVKDSIFNIEKDKDLGRIETTAEFEKKNAIDEAAHKLQLEKQREVAAADKRRQNVVILSVSIGLLLVVGFAIFIFSRMRKIRKQKVLIEAQKDEIETQKHEVEEKNQEITDSINYAKRIQNAILPPLKSFENSFKDSFVLYEPKDIVAGDFYWLEEKDGKVLFAAADCTGHGVPGAMVSVVCNNGLNRSVREHGLTDPGEILNKTREIVIQEFEKSEEEVKDGMDIALCSVQKSNSEAAGASFSLQYAGAHNPLWIVRADSHEISEIKANKQPIGKFLDPHPYETHTVEMNAGDTIYIFSDGFADQFGGEKGKKFKGSNFKKLLLSIVSKPMSEQQLILKKSLLEWRGDLEQLDDVCIIGVKF